MKMQLSIALSFVLFTTMIIGCGPEAQTSPAVAPSTEEVHARHVHGPDDELVWEKENIEFAGYLITLGHHGAHFHGGDTIEPAFMLTKDGADVADAQANCRLLDSEGLKEIATAEMVFEPKTEEEPAHYAQGALKFPAGETSYLIEFTIHVADQKYEGSFPMKVSH